MALLLPPGGRRVVGRPTLDFAGERLDPELEIYRVGVYVMFWSHTPRQPWQTPDYYEEQAAVLRPATFARLHRNEWVSADGSFITAN